MNIRRILIHAIISLTICNGFLTKINHLKKDLLSILTGRPVNTQNPNPNIYEYNSQNQDFQYLTDDGNDFKPIKFMTNNFVKPTTQKPDNLNNNFVENNGGIFLMNHEEDFSSTRKPIVFPDLDNNVDNNGEVETLFRENILMTKFHEKKIRELQRK